LRTSRPRLGERGIRSKSSFVLSAIMTMPSINEGRSLEGIDPRE
jgi:hypothetical protein